MIIRTFNDPVLHRPAAPVKRVGPDTRRLAARMLETMRNNRGAGLAAPQVGVSSRVVVVDVGEGPHILVNPEIVSAAGSAFDWEGCLSYPGLLAEVERAEKVTVKALGLDGRPVWIEGEGYFARALQHEIDHLGGVVFLDRAREVEKIEPEESAEVEPEGSDYGDTEYSDRGADDAAGKAESLRVAFMGTPDFARTTLEALLAADYQVVGVVTRPDRPSGRGGRTLRPSPVKSTALAFGLPVWQGTMREAKAGLGDLLGKWQADVAVVVAYGVILPPDALSAPRLGCINLHASLLPEYRGAAPIQRAIMDGRSLTGVSVIQMDEGVDTGDIICQREVRITESDTAGSLHDRLASTGAALVVHALRLLAARRAARLPQPSEGTVAEKIGPEDEVIDWAHPAEAIARQVRALSPAPGAHTVLGGRRVKVWATRPVATTPAPATGASGETGGGAPVPGQVVGFIDGTPVVRTGRGDLLLTILQPAGSSRMRGADFANGYRLQPGSILGGQVS